MGCALTRPKESLLGKAQIPAWEGRGHSWAGWDLPVGIFSTLFARGKSSAVSGYQSTNVVTWYYSCLSLKVALSSTRNSVSMWWMVLFRIAANGWIGTHNILYRSNTRNAMTEYAYTNHSKLIYMDVEAQRCLQNKYMKSKITHLYSAAASEVAMVVVCCKQ